MLTLKIRRLYLKIQISGVKCKIPDSPSRSGQGWAGWPLGGASVTAFPPPRPGPLSLSLPRWGAEVMSPGNGTQKRTSTFGFRACLIFKTSLELSLFPYGSLRGLEHSADCSEVTCSPLWPGPWLPRQRVSFQVPPALQKPERWPAAVLTGVCGRHAPAPPRTRHAPPSVFTAGQFSLQV